MCKNVKSQKITEFCCTRLRRNNAAKLRLGSTL